MRRFTLAMALLAGLMQAPVAQQAPPAALSVLGTGRDVVLDMTADEAMDLLRGAGFVIEQEVDLPPDGLNRLILAVPAEDDCIPRGARFVCSSIRVVLLNDPQRGRRVVRVEAFEALRPGHSVAQMFIFATTALGPPLETEMLTEQVRGGTVVVWRQRWRDVVTEGPLTEVFVTQDAPARAVIGLADPNQPATGVGTVRADDEAEGAFTAVRRRLRSR